MRRLLIKRTLSGCGVIYTSQKRYELTEGNTFMIQRPGPYRYCYEGDGEPWEFEYVTMILPYTGDWLPASIQREPVWDMRQTPELCEQMAQLVDQLLQTDLPRGIPERMASLDAESIRTSATCYQFYLGCLGSYLRPQQHIPPAAAALRNYLQENFSQQIQIAGVCKEMDYTPEALSRLFRQTYSISPVQYLIRLRLEHARRLLEQSPLPLKQIAAECGFESLNYFCRTFSKHFHTTPNQYRKNPDPLLPVSG